MCADGVSTSSTRTISATSWITYKKCLRDSGIDKHNAHKVMLVDGFTRIPKVQQNRYNRILSKFDKIRLGQNLSKLRILGEVT